MLLASILLVFIILVFELRSFSHPLAILAATILCGSGALLASLTHTSLNISSFMGTIVVVGIAHKNGILMPASENHFSVLAPDFDAACKIGTLTYFVRRREAGLPDLC